MRSLIPGFVCIGVTYMWQLRGGGGGANEWLYARPLATGAFLPSGILQAAEEPALLLHVVGERVDVEVVGGEGDDAEHGVAEHPHAGNLGNAALQRGKLW